jgi:hypothetical protein
MDESKPNSDRRFEGEEGAGAHQEGSNSVQAGETQRRGASAPEQAPKTGRPTRSSRTTSASDSEPGPHDDDGLPENARRRVPS